MNIELYEQRAVGLAPHNGYKRRIIRVCDQHLIFSYLSLWVQQASAADRKVCVVEKVDFDSDLSREASLRFLSAEQEPNV